MIIKDIQKMESPFVRKIINNRYVVTPEINPDYSWVFENPNVKCVEKLDGSNMAIVIEQGKITRIFNRKTEIPFFNKDKVHLIMGILESFGRGYTNFTDGQYFGELIGPKLQGNPYKLDKHVWIPFESYAKNHLAYKSWGKYPKDFETISNWFKNDLFSLYHRRLYGTIVKPEGVVFYHPDGRFAKLRVDMFLWYNGKKKH